MTTKTQPQKTNLSEIEKAETMALVCTESVLNSAVTLKHLNNNLPDLDTLLTVLKSKSKQIKENDLSSIEKILITQIHVLDAIFHNMMLKASNTEFIAQLQTYSEVALKAQNQCRNTIATLIEMKNPKRATFIKQQNLAINQQVNNNDRPKSSKKSEKLANELLSIEKKEDEALDTRRTFTTIPIDSKMETVEISRRKDTRR